MEHGSRHRSKASGKCCSLVSLAIRILVVVFGLATASAGIALYMKSGLGMDAFSVFCGGLAKVLHLSFGRSLQICLLMLIAVIAAVDRRLLGIGTLMHAFLMGIFIDTYNKLRLIPAPSTQLGALSYVAIGVVLVGAGLAIYIKAGLGSGAYDALMLLIHTRLHGEIRWIKTGLDFVLAVAGFALGGPLGIATLASILFTGPVIQLSMKAIDSISPKARHI